MTPAQFIAKWKKAELKERAACQEHFLDLCSVLGVETPAQADPEGNWFTFERSLTKEGGGKGFADVWRKNHFGWEYKGKRKDLNEALVQLQRYREALLNPPLLIVCDLNRFEIHTNFTNQVKRIHSFDLDGLVNSGMSVSCFVCFSTQIIRHIYKRIATTRLDPLVQCSKK